MNNLALSFPFICCTMTFTSNMCSGSSLMREATSWAFVYLSREVVGIQPHMIETYAICTGFKFCTVHA